MLNEFILVTVKILCDPRYVQHVVNKYALPYQPASSMAWNVSVIRGIAVATTEIILSI